MVWLSPTKEDDAVLNGQRLSGGAVGVNRDDVAVDQDEVGKFAWRERRREPGREGWHRAGDQPVPALATRQQGAPRADRNEFDEIPPG